MNLRTIRFSLFFLVLMLAVGAGPASGQAPDPASGEVVGGLRLLRLSPGSEPLHLKVYRGDYVKFLAGPGAEGTPFSIPDLDVAVTLPSASDEAPLVKMKETGRFRIVAGGASGVLEVVDFESARYRELTSRQAADLIHSVDPLLLDVRTRKEYAQGHLSGSILIPVQELQQRMGELAAYKDRDVVIYCATGNRSTVAARILLDAGFERVYNIRYGIFDWLENRLPIVR